MDTRNNILNSAAEAERIYYTYEEAIEEYFEDYQPHDGIRVRYKPWDYGKYPIQLFDDLFEPIAHIDNAKFNDEMFSKFVDYKDIARQYEEYYDTIEIDTYLSDLCEVKNDEC